MSESEQKQLEALPALETVCGKCHGDGEINHYSYGEPCAVCGSTGYIPTEEGKRILTLIRHNMRGLMRGEILRMID